MKNKRILTAILSMVAAVFTVAFLGGITVSAAELTEPVSGDCGDGVTWTLDVDGSLTVSGSGEMQFSTSPWAGYKDNIKTVTIEQGVTSIANGAFSSCNNLTKATLSSSVTHIGNAAFAGSANLSEINLPDSITAIDDYAFTASGVKNVTLPANLTKVSSNLFSGCRSLEYVYIPDSVTTFGNSVFAGSSITSVRLPENMTTIPASLFANCDISSIEFPKNLTTIEDNAFYYCDFETLTIPEGVTKIGDNAFCQNTKLKSVVLPSTLKEIGMRAFDTCTHLEKISIPGSVEVVGDYAFCQCYGLTAVTFREGSAETAIGEYAFQSCSSLKSVVISSNVVYIGGSSFNDCKNVEAVYCNFDPENLTWIDTDGDDFKADRKTICYVPSSPVSYLEKYESKFHSGSAFDVNVTFKGDHDDMEIGDLLSGYSLSLEGDIGVNFYLRFKNADALSENAKMVFTIKSVDGKHSRTQEVYVKSQTDTSRAVATQSGGYYVFKCTVNAKEMTSKITAQVIDGETSGKAYDYTVQEYAKYMLQHPDTYSKEQDLIKTMLNYGTACQSYFNYNQGNYANSVLSGDDRDLSIVTAEEVNAGAELNDLTIDGTDLKIAKASLILNTTITEKLYLSGVTENMVFMYGDEVLTPVKEGDYYVIKIVSIPAYRINFTYNIKVLDGNKRLGTVNYSPLYYCRLVIDHEEDATVTRSLKVLISTMVRYNKAAYKYRPPVPDDF
jgi:hypothetical protein